MIRRLGFLTVASLLLSAVPITGQTFQGRVVEDGSEQPISTALIRLVDSAGGQHALTISDSAGVYRLEAPEPGVYRIEAARLGYHNFETPLLAASEVEGIYPVDLLLAPAPVELPGFTVETRRLAPEQADREIRRIIGLDVRSLRFRPIDYDQIQDHLAKAHDLVDVVRWQNSGAILVRRTTEGPCFSLRGSGCLPVYLNGMELHRDFVQGAPLDMIERIVILTPSDASIVYPAGAVLLYTEAWLR